MCAQDTFHFSRISFEAIPLDHSRFNNFSYETESISNFYVTASYKQLKKS